MSGPRARMRELEKEAYGSNVRVRRKSEQELIYTILKAVKAEERVTAIEQRAGISPGQWKKHRFLIDKGYIIEKTEGSRKTYSLGKLGRKYIRWFDFFWNSGRKAFDYDSYIFPEGNIKLKEIPKKNQRRKKRPKVLKPGTVEKIKLLEKPKEIPKEIPIEPIPIRLTVKSPSEEEKMFNDLEEFLDRTMSSLTPNYEPDVMRRISNFLNRSWEYSLTKPSPSALFRKLEIEGVLIQDSFMDRITYKLRKKPKI